MKGRFISILASLMLLVALVPAATSNAVVCNNGTLTFYDGASGSGAHTNPLCADYGFAWSFDQPAIKFTDGTTVDNRISSIRFSSLVPDAFDFKAYASYYFNSGDTWTLSPNGALLVNVPSLLNNRISSWKNLGQ
jgi:hypothetical protein